MLNQLLNIHGDVARLLNMWIRTHLRVDDAHKKTILRIPDLDDTLKVGLLLLYCVCNHRRIFVPGDDRKCEQILGAACQNEGR